MENQQPLKLVQNTPTLLKDVSLFKIALLPSELYALKYFIITQHPITIRELFGTSITITFYVVFGIEYITKDDPKFNLVHNLREEGYGNVFISPEEKHKVLKEYIKKVEGISETDKIEEQARQLSLKRVRVMSYDKLKSIIGRFENLGIIRKVGRGKGMLYTLNPQFYTLFKDKFEDIIKL